MRPIDLYPINEGGINAIMRHGKHGFFIISANRSKVASDNAHNDLTNEFKDWCILNNGNPEDHETAKSWLAKRNKNEDERLHIKLKSSPYSFTPVYGGYKGTDGVTDNFEPSYIVYNHAKGDANANLNFDKFLDFAIKLTNDFKQDSVYIQEPDNKPPYYVDGNGNKVSDTSTNNFKVNRDNEEFFTTTKRDKTNPQRFTADIQFESMYHMPPSTYFMRIKESKLGHVFLT